MKNFMLAVLASGMWVNFSEFIRNEFLFKQRWIDKYDSLGLVFPSSPVNGAVWVLWGFLFAGCIVYLIRKLNFKETLIIGWIMGFVLMWIVVGNMNFLPFGLLMVAVPWSIIEVALAVIIARRIIGMRRA
jgi:hypothetical protein